MKKVKFRGTLNGKVVKGFFLSEERPNNAKAIAESICHGKLDKFVSVSVDMKVTMIKCE